MPPVRLGSLIRSLLTADGHGAAPKAAALRYLIANAGNITQPELDAAIEAAVAGSCSRCGTAGHSGASCPRFGASR